jgi:iron complex transport system permease protein
MPSNAVLTIDDLGRSTNRRRIVALIVALGFGLAGTIVAGVSIGPALIAPTTVWLSIAHHVFGYPGHVTWDPNEDEIVWLVRSPRVLVGAIVGAGLAVSGAALQALVRNVLADPFLLGVSSGASTGAAATVVFGLGAFFGAGSVAGAGFAGALAATATVLMIARVAGRVTSTRLLLAGVTVGYALSAMTSFLIFASGSRDGIETVLFWLLGSLALAQWSTVLIPAIIVLCTTALLTAWGRRLDAISIGDETSLALGTDPARFRIKVFVVVSACVAAVVAISGAIGFVGLVIPHVARRIVGSEHRRVIVVAALLGAIFLVFADAFARTAVRPAEIPIGIVTALAGTPFLLSLVRRFQSM